MTFCRKCGVANRESANFCKSCSTPLNADAEIAIRRVAQTAMINPAKSPGLAAVLSFFICGLGQIYNGQILKGLLLIVLYSVSIGLTFVLVGFITTPILWIYGMIDAYRTAERMNFAATITSAVMTTSR